MHSFSAPIPAFSFLTAGKIRFGRGTAQDAVGDVAGFGTRVALVRGRSVPWVDGFADNLAEAGCDVIAIAGHREPTTDDVDTAVARARAAGVQVVVAVGGGAVIDLAKAIAALVPATGPALSYLEGIGGGQPLPATPLPMVALPTTAGTGAEVTRNAVIGVPESGRKVSLRDDRMLPRLAIVDPALTDNAPPAVTMASGLDALAQVIEPYLSRRANPLTDAICRAAIPVGLKALARLARGEDAAARDALAYVSLSGGLALANSGLGAIHGLAGVIGGAHGAPHGLICGRLLGPILIRNREAARTSGADPARHDEIAGWIADALHLPRDNAFAALARWLDDLAVARLGQWIAPETDLHPLARDAAASSSGRANPFDLPPETLVSALREAL
ncbi:MAG: iron-containing alcohol dehydrogenase [Rhodobacteraceae bacterium]|nr:iron-containing alcohol dehydrogenase [Paracoccaceae bacterium]